MKIPLKVAAIALLLNIQLVTGCKKNEEPEATPIAPSGPGARPSPRGPSAAAPGPTSTTGAIVQKGDDAVTTAKVKNALMTSKKKIDWKTINVDTSGGTIHLKGTVPSADQKTNAESEAKAAAAGKTVVNELEVKGGK